MRKYKICIISHAHLTNNPRVYKEAIALDKSGYEVSIVTLLINQKLYESDKKLLMNYNIDYSSSINLIPQSNNRLKILFSKLVRRSAQLLSRYFKIELPQALCYNIKDLLKIAENKNADLYIGHNEPGLWTGVELIKKGKKVAFDFEDWYSNDYLVPGRTVKLLAELENYALMHGEYITTTSQSLASALAKEYYVKPPTVVYNAFPYEVPNSKLRADDSDFKLYWFSQSIGPDRGLEQIIAALNHVTKPVILNLRGDVNTEFKEQLESQLTNQLHKIQFLHLINPRKITSDMNNFDVGLSLELNYPKSRDLTVTNKILHYLSGGLPVLASHTKGQEEIFKLSDGAVEMIELNNPEKTAIVINNLIDNKEKLKFMHERAKKISVEKFNWETLQKVLLTKVAEVLNQN